MGIGRPPRVCAPRATGLAAPLVLNPAMNGVAFLAYIKPVSAPALSPRDVVVLDNPSSHEVSGVSDAELAFSKLKRLLQDAAETTVATLSRTIGRLLDGFNPAECANYIRHCGFKPSRQ